jgi:hypothetical protein
VERAKGIEPSYAAWEARHFFKHIKDLAAKLRIFDAK